MKKTLHQRALATVTVTTMLIAACTDKPTPNMPSATQKTELAGVSSGSCELPPLAVPVGALLGRDWGQNALGAFPFTAGGPEPAPGNVTLTLRLNLKLSGGVLSLASVTGETPAGDKAFLPALINSPVKYGPPTGGYTETPEHFGGALLPKLVASQLRTQMAVTRRNVRLSQWMRSPLSSPSPGRISRPTSQVQTWPRLLMQKTQAGSTPIPDE